MSGAEEPDDRAASSLEANVARFHAAAYEWEFNIHHHVVLGGHAACCELRLSDRGLANLILVT
jgi:hypothetical protein